ncbi:hypothetical protein LZZ90_10705 [Flavobacterium sp. SM15]|uniref:hypothetical protein n=1 Tax=Flavobacterium sp. SM15 TaxID=2908005 RepID=UPI001EDBF90E|nr:hypothetical protein [Flavobacterium sp. SM15]MCG2611977.1 hypothetical protein [Flavobacterium sp. SM15]
MKKLVVLFLAVLAFSCGEKKKILLPKANVSVVKNVDDISTIDFFFTTENNDTIANVSKNTVISTTNWVFNIDKRLPLKTILPDIIKLQEKKRKKQEGAVAKTANYYSYADSIGKNLAFFSFTNTVYKLQKPLKGIVVYFDKSNKVYVNDSLVERENLQKQIVNLNQELKEVHYCFDKNMLYNDYILNKLFLNTIEHKMTGVTEYVY